MEIIENRAIKLRVRRPERILNLIPKSKRVGEHEIVVHWGMDESRVLNNLGVKVPSPIIGKYKWPGMYKPMSHQITTAAFLTLNRRAFCFSEPGTGKTGSCIWAADYLMNLGLIRRVLIICPVSIMDQAWREDMFKFAMHRSVDVAAGTAEKRRRIVKTDPEFLIINYDGVQVVEKEIVANNYDLVIIDESNSVKNPSTNRWKTIRRILSPDAWLWMLTGTPAANSPMEAYGLAKLANPQSVPRTVGGFRDLVMVRVSQFKWVPKATAKDIVHEVLQPAIRYTKDECLDLPPLIFTRRDVELSRQQQKYYAELKNRMRMVAAGEVVTSANAAVSLNKLLQVSAGAVYSDDGEVLRFDIAGRYSELLDVISESSRKVLVFAMYKPVIDMLVEKLRNDGISTEYIRGDVSASKRDRIFKHFQNDPDPRVLVIQPQAAAHGITLTAADTVVWWGPTPSLELWTQGNSRAHRKGQHHPCLVVQLQGSFAERHIYSLLNNRIDVNSKILELYKQVID